MIGHLTPVVIGEGVAEAHPEGAYGTVVGVFRHGCYVQVDHEIYAVAGPAVAAGPIHLIVERAPEPIPEGLAVWRDRGRLRTTEWQIELSTAPVYTPRIPTSVDLWAASGTLLAMQHRLTVPDDLASCWESVTQVADDLTAARQLLEGRGGGLTPTGDDVLAGLLLVHAWSGADRDRLLGVARAAATTNLSRSFLRWAARGRSIAPLHDLMACAVAGDGQGFDRAVATVSAIGGSSGVALLCGVGLAATATLTKLRAATVRPARTPS